MLWVIGYLNARPIFLDEANVARNLFDRSYGQLFSPLDHQQYAPPLYLCLAKLCGDLFGYSELALRLPALLGGATGVAGLVACGRSLKLGYWGLAPLGFLLLNDVSLRYFGSVKPYALDLGIAACLVALALRSLRADRWWVIIGAVIPWLSLPSVFLLAGIGVAAITRADADRRERWRWISTGVIWLTSFACLYVTVLSPSVGSESLNTFHARYFFPIRSPSGGIALIDSFALLVATLAVPFGHTVLAVLAGTLLSVYYATRRFGATSLVLWLPIGIVLAASAFRLYSLIPRLLLFTLPCWWLIATLGAKKMYERYALRPAMRYLAIGLLLASLSAINYSGHFLPQVYSDSHALVTDYDARYHPVLHPLAFPAFEYYHRIHPDGSGLPRHSVGHGDGDRPGRSVLLFDITTSATIKAQIHTNVTRAAERGCKVERLEMYRAEAVYLDCPGLED